MCDDENLSREIDEAVTKAGETAGKDEGERRCGKPAEYGSPKRKQKAAEQHGTPSGTLAPEAADKHGGSSHEKLTGNGQTGNYVRGKSEKIKAQFTYSNRHIGHGHLGSEQAGKDDGPHEVRRGSHLRR